MPTEAPRYRGWRAEIERLRNGSYPAFVTDHRPDPGRIGLPVFVYHTIEPTGFEADLRFLSENGYETLDADSFHAILSGDRDSRGKEVLLTIDDGRSSAWVWACPLLERYGQRAVLFAIPGCVPDRAQPRPRSDDQASTGLPPERAVEDRDPELMSWEEIELAHRAGVLDIQSHTLFHRQVPVGPEIEDFVHPHLDSPYYAVPVPLDVEVNSTEAVTRLYGLPVFRSKPLLATAIIYREAPQIREAAMDLVRSKTGASFFQRPDWRRELIGAIRRARQSSPEKGELLAPAEVRAAILDELGGAKEMIETRLGDKSVDHLCLPFGAGSQLTVELAKEAGYKTVFWSARKDRSLNEVGSDPLHCVRLKHDYISRLPGKNRRSLRSVLLRKVARRLRGEAVY